VERAAPTETAAETASRFTEAVLAVVPVPVRAMSWEEHRCTPLVDRL
jgi:hypothetical protein